MKALLVVDIQNDFCPGGALAVKEGDKIISLINRLKQSKQFSLVVLTQDWHPKNHSSFAFWPDHCVQGTWGAQFHKDLKVSEGDVIIRKGTDPQMEGYSAFYDNAHKKETGLTKILKEKKVAEIFICGLATDYCVKFSTLDAIAEGFKSNVILDACRGVDLKPGDVQKAVGEMKAHGANMVYSLDLG